MAASHDSAALPGSDRAAQPSAAASPPGLTAQRRDMAPADLDAVCAIERLAYEFPWTRGNFADSLQAGYRTELLLAPAGPATPPAQRCGADELLGYSIAMHGVDEAHLLNLTVAPRWQRRGLARTLLSALCFHCATHRLQWLLLEVRPSNHAARQLYARCGFVEIGRRRGYYPAADGREDALVLRLDAAQALANHALD